MDRFSTPTESIKQVVETLPAPARVELAQFIDYLRYKYGELEPSSVVLEGLWAGIDFDVDDAGVRELRAKISAEAVGRLTGDELPG